MVPMKFWSYYISNHVINGLEVVMVVHVQNDCVWMDIVSDLYSKPIAREEMGIRQLDGGPFDTLRKYAVPILHRLRENFGGVGKNIATTVKEASGATLRKIAQEIPGAAAEGVKKVLERGTEKFIKTLGKKRVAPPTPSSKRHKRSRIDEVLGDDSY